MSFRIIMFLIFSSLCLHASPKMEVEGNASFDFGIHQSNLKKENSYRIKNSGDEDLEIRSVNKTCGGCVEISVPGKTVAPGGNAEIKISIVPGTLSGPYVKNFFVETNDPGQKFTKFTFSGTAVPVAEIKPSNLMYIGKIDAGTACKREFLIVPTDKGTEFGEPVPECSQPVKVTASSGEKGLSVFFEFTPEKNAGDMKCRIKVPVLKPEGWPPLEILVSASIAGTVPITPVLPVKDKEEKAIPEKKTSVAVIEYFHQAGCNDCRMIDTFVIPKMEESFHGRYRIEKYDTALMDSFLRFAYRRDKLDIKGNETVCMIVNGRHAFNGYKNIEAGLLKQLGDSLKLNEEPDTSFKLSNDSEKEELLKRHADKITLGALIVAGLVDGINPCVFATLVFFMSVLAVSGIRGRKLLLFGSVYCLACFLTYLLLGSEF